MLECDPSSLALGILSININPMATEMAEVTGNMSCPENGGYVGWFPSLSSYH